MTSKYWKYKRRNYILNYGLAAWQKYRKRRKQKRYERTPRGCYIRHKENARRRGIEWQFTFETWYACWQASGHWQKRGNKKGQYVMARKGDVGPYSHSNCIIVKSETNAYAQGVMSSYFSRSQNSEYENELAAIL